MTSSIDLSPLAHLVTSCRVSYKGKLTVYIHSMFIILPLIIYVAIIFHVFK